jgi:hypothetical protein
LSCTKDLPVAYSAFTFSSVMWSALHRQYKQLFACT